MIRRNFLKTSASGIVGSTFMASNQSAETQSSDSQKQPNILLIMCDQLVPMLTGAYGHPVVKTPNLNRLAAKGIRFDATYTPCPICAPARACMLTGTYTSTNKVYDNAAALKCDIPTFCHYLTNAGYQTALSGKMHFVGADQLHGFKERFTPNIYPTDFSWTKSRDHKIPRPHAYSYLGKSVKIGKNTTGFEPDQRITGLNFDELTHERALEFIDKQKQRNNDPFFLCVSFHHPHEPFHPPQEFWDLYNDEDIELPSFPDDWRERLSIMDKWLIKHSSVDQVEGLLEPDSLRRVRRAYYALVSYIDKKAGELMNRLEKNGLANNTIILFTSDHGDMLCEKGMVQKRGFYEFSSRVPLIIAFPDGRQAGTTRNEPVSLIDLLPTILDMAGVPEKDRLDMQGKSLMPLINSKEIEKRVVFSENHSEGMYSTCFMARKGKYKYIYIHGYEDECQLFNLEDDPDEWNNLAGKPEYKKIEHELKHLILQQFNPDEIEQDLRQSIAQRMVIVKAMVKNNIDWKYNPEGV